MSNALQYMERHNWSYLGGLFDGEGSAGVYRYRRDKTLGGYQAAMVPVCQLKMTDREPVDLLSLMFPAYGVYEYKIKSGKTVYVWSCSYKGAVKFSKKILPYLVNKSKIKQIRMVMNAYGKV